MSTDANRRQTLLMASGVGLAAALPRTTFAAPFRFRPPLPPRIGIVTEDHFGTVVSDPYRWMEAESPEWRAYVDEQAAYTKKLLGSISGRHEIFQETASLLGEISIFAGLQVAGDKIFLFETQPGALNFRLLVKEQEAAPSRVLVDPPTLLGPTATIDWWVASPDAKHVVFGVSSAGTERAQTRILEVETRRLLPEALEGIVLMPPSWHPDGQSFFYNRLNPMAPISGAEALKHTSCWVHRLQIPQSQDVRIMGPGLDASIPFKDTERPLAIVTPGTDVVVGRIRDGVCNFVRLYAGSLKGLIAGRPGWRPICTADDQVTQVVVRASDIYLLATKDAPQGQILKVTEDRPAIRQATLVFPQDDSVIKYIAATADGLYFADGLGGRYRLRRRGPAGQIEEVVLPRKGAITYLYGDVEHEGAWIAVEDWVSPPTVIRAPGAGSAIITDLAPAPPIDLSRYTSEEVEVRTPDGALVPLSIAYRKDLRRDGSAPLLMEAYGAYGNSLEPSFDVTILPLLDRGGAYAVAHVRGGGERGEAWHRAGQKANKPNTWRDAIAAAEHLIVERYTSSAKLAVVGASAGGIMVGRFITERPDLAAVAISEAGVSNPIRFESTRGGPANVPEFGTASTPDGFEALLAMDAYQHVRNGVRYPAVMLLTGLNDPRVPPWQVTKMAARLQAATASGAPVLLRVDTDAGHSGASIAQVTESWTDILSFILWRTGQPGFSTTAWP